MRLNRPGFSMLELLTVLIITGVVTGLSMGRFTAYLAHERVAKAAVGIADDLRMAFAVPGRIRRPVRIWCDTSKMQLRVTDRAQSTAYRKTAFGSRYNLKSSNVKYYPSSSWIEVYPNGFASDTMVITLSSNGYSQRIKVSKGGMVQVQAR
jgi:prepilin-type N-terminal cleavage/methylation domain-containing protein